LKEKKKKQLEPNIGTLEFRAPEIFSDSKSQLVKYTEKIDIWAFGMILFELLTLQIPYNDETKGDIFAITDLIKKGIRPVLPKSGKVLPVLYDKCTEISPMSRPSASEIIHFFNTC